MNLLRIVDRGAHSTRRSALGAAALTLLLFASANADAGAQEVQAKEPNRGGALDLAAQDPEVARRRLTPAAGYEVTLFASERDFPIGNPVAMAFDSRGRLWVATAPSYPHYDPASPPDDRLVVLEDTNGDGRADRHTVFADSLYLPLGFELGDGGVYIAQQPNLLFLRDRDGDGVADERRILLHGFGTEDSHHALHAFTWGPDGALYMQEGTFHHSQVETPHGPVRLVNGGVFRYEPEAERLSVYVTYPFANPWGHAFDRWGQNFIADASDGSNYFALPISGRLEYPRKHLSMQVFTRSRVRPTAGAEIVSSRHFPDDVQGNFLLTNTIGFQGIKSHRMVAGGSGFTTEDAPPLLASSDINFRPIDMEFGPDGSLYVVDWFNPLIGHMQYSMRDPRRDHSHGRIWRLTAKGRPLLVPVDLSSISAAALLDRLKLPEDRERYRVRRELRSRDRSEVARELTRWTAALDSSDAAYEHHLLEALWVHRSHGLAAPQLLDRLLNAKDHRARAAAVRVLRFERRAADAALPLLRRFVSDSHPLVRLEAVVALSDIPSPDAAVAALDALRHPRDYYLDYALGETITALEGNWKPALLSGAPFAADNAAGVLLLLDRLGPDEVGRVARSPAVNRSLLQRSGVGVQVRRAVLADLVASDRRSGAVHLLDAMRVLDTLPGAVATADELAGLLAERPRDELRSVRREIQALATTGRNARLREAAFGALMLADGGVEEAWSLVSARSEGQVDLLNAARFVPAGPVREALRARALTLARGSAPAAPAGIHARFVRIEQPGCCETQSLAEVEVLDAGANVALRGAAEQKSTAPGGEAARAVDGNRATLFRQGSVSQSQVLEADPWWELDLGETRSIDRVAIWRRSDAQLGGDMEGFNVRLLDGDRRPVWQGEKLSAAAQPIVVTPGSAAPSVRRAAVRALAVLGGDDAARAALFGELLDRGVEPDLAAAGLVAAARALPDGPMAVESLQRLARYAASLPESDQGGPTMVGIRTLAAARAAAGSAVAARTVGELERLAPKRVAVRAVPAAMRFDVEAFTVEPGRIVELVLENPDHMPHNLVLTAPGAADRVGRAADAMAALPDGFARHFVPQTPEVLHATRLLATGERAVLRFRAPAAAGAYPYICSFPGHWVTMRGAMTVTNGVAPAPAPTPTAAP